MSRLAVCLVFIAIFHNSILKVAQADETTTDSVTKTIEDEEEITSPTVLSTPVVTKPVVTTPVVTTPIVTTPVMTTPVMSTPVITTPVMSTPVVTTPIVTIPVVKKPVVTTPVVTTPVMTTPVISTPVMSTPVVTSPVMSTPVVSTPVMSTPVESTPIKSTPVMSTQVMSAPAMSTTVMSTPVVLPTAIVAKGEKEVALIAKSEATTEELAKTKLKEVFVDIVNQISAISNKEEDSGVSGVTIKENLEDLKTDDGYFQNSVSLINGVPMKQSQLFFEFPQKTILQPINAVYGSVQDAIANSIDSANNLASGTFTFFKEMNNNFGVPGRQLF